MNIERYQTYKYSEVKWLGDIPEHWETCVVKRVAKVGHKNFVDGEWIESPYITDQGIRLIQTGNVGIGIYKEKGGRYISEKTFNDFNCTEIFPNDVLVCRLDGPVGRACLVPDLQARMITSVDNTILKPSKDFDSKFIVYVMSSSLWLEWTQALCRVGGGFRFRISRSMLGELRIQKPPLSEQEAIAHYLDTKTAQIDHKIDLLTQKVTLYSNLKQSLINETVTHGLDKSVPMKDSGIEWLGEIPEYWKARRLKDIFTYTKGYAFKSDDFINSGTPVVKATDIKQYRVLESTSFLESSVIESYKNVLLKNNDIVITTVGSQPNIVDSAVGQLARIDEKTAGSLLNQNTLILRITTKRISSEFLYYILISNFFRQHLDLIARGTANQSSIKVSETLEYLFFLPSFEEQKTIADYLDTKTTQIDQIIQTINTQIEKLKELRKTLINDVVTGKIKVV